MKLGEILQIEKNNKINIDDNETYVIAGMQSYGNGVINKRKERGKDLKMKKYQVIKENQLMWCKVDTKNGAFGITRLEHKGSLASSNMALANINLKKINPEFLQLLFTIPSFYNYINGFCTGTTNRKYLKPKEVLELIEIPDLNLKEQNLILEKYKKVKKIYENLEKEIANQSDYIDKLKASILGLALKGKLVSQDESDEPANVLLERIKKEKEQRIKDKKIKKEKTMPEIREDEIPYELPKSWEWVRIGEITTIRGGKRIPSGSKIQTEPTEHIYIRITDMKNGTIEDNDLRYIDDKTYEKIKNYIITSEDIYITIAGTIAQVGIVPLKFNNMNLTENAARITPHIINKIWLKFFFESSIVKNALLDKVNQVAQPKLALTRIKNTLIPLPPLNEQKRIVKKIDSLMILCDELENEINNSKQLSKNLMTKLLDEELSK